MQCAKTPVQRVTTPEDRVTPFFTQNRSSAFPAAAPAANVAPDAKKRKSKNQARPLAMPPSKFTYDLPPDAPSAILREDSVEYGFIGTLHGLNFREKFEALNRARLTDGTALRKTVLPGQLFYNTQIPAPSSLCLAA